MKTLKTRPKLEPKSTFFFFYWTILCLCWSPVIVALLLSQNRWHIEMMRMLCFCINVYFVWSLVWFSFGKSAFVGLPVKFLAGGFYPRDARYFPQPRCTSERVCAYEKVYHQEKQFILKLQWAGDTNIVLSFLSADDWKKFLFDNESLCLVCCSEYTKSKGCQHALLLGSNVQFMDPAPVWHVSAHFYDRVTENSTLSSAYILIRTVLDSGSIRE